MFTSKLGTKGSTPSQVGPRRAGSRQWVCLSTKSRIGAAAIKVVRRNLNRRLARLSRRLRLTGINTTHSNQSSRPWPADRLSCNLFAAVTCTLPAMTTECSKHREQAHQLHPRFQLARRGVGHRKFLFLSQAFPLPRCSVARPLPGACSHRADGGCPEDSNARWGRVPDASCGFGTAKRGWTGPDSTLPVIPAPSNDWSRRSWQARSTVSFT